jgi:hypothetical protein
MKWTKWPIWKLFCPLHRRAHTSLPPSHYPLTPSRTHALTHLDILTLRIAAASAVAHDDFRTWQILLRFWVVENVTCSRMNNGLTFCVFSRLIAFDWPENSFWGAKRVKIRSRDVPEADLSGDTFLLYSDTFQNDIYYCSFWPVQSNTLMVNGI